MITRQILLELDEIDYATIMREIARRRKHGATLCPEDPDYPIVPDTESNFEGAIIAEIVRDLEDCRNSVS